MYTYIYIYTKKLQFAAFGQFVLASLKQNLNMKVNVIDILVLLIKKSSSLEGYVQTRPEAELVAN